MAPLFFLVFLAIDQGNEPDQLPSVTRRRPLAQ
jgi:hypothetical protein